MPDDVLVDPYANAVNSPIAIVRIPARREREYLAFRILGFTRYPDGELRPGSDAQKRIARQWLLAR